MRKKLILWRTHGTDRETLGYLEIAATGQRFGYTLEDPIRENKIKGDTCIPFGTYQVKVTHSSRFKRPLPLIYNTHSLVVLANNGDVWSGVRFHGGNHHDDTEGCPLIAKHQYTDKPQKFKGKTYNNWIQGSLEKEITELIGNDVWDLEIRHIDEKAKQTLIKLRNPLMKNDLIYKIQSKLIVLGYKPGKADGIYGENSATAVKKFQADHGLSADGIVGPATLAKLNL